MLVLQIAGGIILAYLAIKFWRVAIGVAVVGLLAVVGFVWWIAVKGGNATAVKAWEFTWVLGSVLVLVSALKFFSGFLDQWAKDNPESRTAARLLRLRDAITPSDLKSKKP